MAFSLRDLSGRVERHGLRLRAGDGDRSGEGDGLGEGIRDVAVARDEGA